MTGKTPNIFEIILLWWRQFIFSRFDTKIQCSKIFANDKAEKSYHFLLRMSIAPLFSWLYPYQSMRIVYLTNLFGSLSNYAVFWMYFPKDSIHAQPECEMKISYSKGFEAIFLTDLISIIQLLDGIHPLLSISCFTHIFENICSPFPITSISIGVCSHVSSIQCLRNCQVYRPVFFYEAS